MLQLTIGTVPLTLLKGEYLEFHDGRDGFKFNLDCSICDIIDLDRAEKLKIALIQLYPFAPFKAELIQILSPKGEKLTFEVLFSISDFCPIIKEVI